jgi:pimeloyl-ACP methyl ester carboxylesterase
MKSSYFLINRARTHYLQWNADSNFRPALLLHGLAEGARVWEKVAPALGQNNWRVLAPDLRGHGMTDNLEGELRLDTFVVDLAAFIDAAQIERPLLVGSGLGAAVALDYAARVSIGPRAPSGLVLLEGGLPFSGTKTVLEQVGQIDGLTVDHFLRSLAEAPGKWTPDDEDAQILLSFYEIDNDETLLPRLTRDQGSILQKLLLEQPAFERLGRLHCPVLAILAHPPAPLSPEEVELLLQKEQAIAQARQANSGLQVRWLADCAVEAPLHRPRELVQILSEFAAHLPE